MCKKLVSAVLLLTLMAMCFCLVGCGEKVDVGAQYVTPDELKAAINGGENILLLDIQAEDAPALAGAIVTKAAPLDNASLMQKMTGKEGLLNGNAPIYILTEDGGDVANIARERLFEDGIKSERLFILEGGMNNWTYTEYLQ